MSLPAPPPAGPFRLTREGRFAGADGTPVWPLGVNYWPASCGVELWPLWPADEIRADLGCVRSLGLNCVRFFLRWQDFEPAEGRYDETMFARLDALLAWHAEHDLLAHPTLFVGYMSGGVFWPDWLRGRNLFTDPGLRERAAAFAERVARHCAPHAVRVLALDLGNELGCLPECQAAPPADVAAWCATMTTAVRRGFPGALIVSGSEQTQVMMDAGWRFGAQPGCDFYSMHTYPVSAWHSLAFDGMTDPLAQSLLPFYVKCARAWGPVLVQEFGTLLTRGEAEGASYLNAVLPACVSAGANGFLWWCLRDITFTGHPYDKCAFEGQLGLVDANGAVKPALRGFIDFAERLRAGETFDAPAPAAPTALYWPREYYARDNPRNPGNVPGELSRQLILAHFALQLAGAAPDVVRDLANLPVATVLVLPGVRLTATETAALRDWVESGGRMILHGLDAMTWGADMSALVGAEPIDFRAPEPCRLHWDGADWEFRSFAREIRLAIRLTSAEPLAHDHAGRPFLFRHEFGRGRVVACLAEADRDFASRSTQRAEHAHWRRWYTAALAALA